MTFFIGGCIVFPVVRDSGVDFGGAACCRDDATGVISDWPAGVALSPPPPPPAPLWAALRDADTPAAVGGDGARDSCPIDLISPEDEEGGGGGGGGGEGGRERRGRGLLTFENKHSTDVVFRRTESAFCTTLKVSHAGKSDLGSNACSQRPSCEGTSTAQSRSRRRSRRRLPMTTRSRRGVGER